METPLHIPVEPNRHPTKKRSLNTKPTLCFRSVNLFKPYAQRNECVPIAHRLDIIYDLNIITNHL